jgi:hypothetical protein
VGIEVADIFREYGPAYREKYGERMPPHHLEVMRAIERCRTEALGGHVYICPECGEIQYRYHSCRDRHCPKCQNEQAQEWLQAQQDLLLPVPYFMLTFTVPSGLNEVIRRHQSRMYAVLFQASSTATQKLAKDLRFVGGQIGMVGVLHTWGRNLSYHPHLHYLVPGGGLSANGRSWLSAQKDFFVPVKALSRIFRAKFREALQETELFGLIPSTVWQQEWGVHCQSVGDGRTALKYLAPYIFRVAISNRRILKLENGQVTFQYRTTDTGQLRLCTLSAEEFIRRFLQHVLPKGFVKVRYYGIFAPGCRKRLATLRSQLELIFPENVASELAATQEPTQVPLQPTLLCPTCGHPLVLQRTIPPTGRYPP